MFNIGKYFNKQKSPLELFVLFRLYTLSYIYIYIYIYYLPGGPICMWTPPLPISWPHRATPISIRTVILLCWADFQLRLLESFYITSQKPNWGRQKEFVSNVQLLVAVTVSRYWIKRKLRGFFFPVTTTPHCWLRRLSSRGLPVKKHGRKIF